MFCKKYFPLFLLTLELHCRKDLKIDPLKFQPLTNFESLNILTAKPKPDLKQKPNPTQTVNSYHNSLYNYNTFPPI